MHSYKKSHKTDWEYIEKLSKWREIPCTWEGTLIIYYVLQNLIRIQHSPNENPVSYTVVTNKLNLNLRHKIQNSLSIIEEEEKKHMKTDTIQFYYLLFVVTNNQDSCSGNKENEVELNRESIVKSHINIDNW